MNKKAAFQDMFMPQQAPNTLEQLQQKQMLLLKTMERKEPTLLQKMIRAGMFASVGFLAATVLGFDPIAVAATAAAGSTIHKTAEGNKKMGKLFKTASDKSDSKRKILVGMAAGIGLAAGGAVGYRMKGETIANALNKIVSKAPAGVKGRVAKATSGMKNRSFKRAVGAPAKVYAAGGRRAGASAKDAVTTQFNKAKTKVTGAYGTGKAAVTNKFNQARAKFTSKK